MPTADERAIEIRHKVKSYGLWITAHGSIVSVTAKFEPGNANAYNEAEARCYEILAMFRQVRAGSTWGTEGVGGAIALEKGQIIMSKSGCEKLLASRFYSGLNDAR